MSFLRKLLTQSDDENCSENMLDSLFNSDTKDIDRNDIKLVDCVEKIDTTEDCIFCNIMNDLGSYIDRVGLEEDDVRKMAYAYTRRTAAAGLCAQGLWGEEEFQHSLDMFYSFQQTTGPKIGTDVEFQKRAAEQSLALFLSYDSRLVKKFLYPMTEVVMKDASRMKNTGQIIFIEKLIEIFNKT